LAIGNEVTKIELNENDENKGADTIIKINGIEKGIQITQLVFNEVLKRQDVAKKRSLQISQLITEDLEIDFKLNIIIYPPNHNTNKKDIPKNKEKLNNSLAREIRKIIKVNLNKLKNSTESIVVGIEKESLEKIVTLISLNPIPKGLYSVFPGQKNVYVDYQFDNHLFDHKDVIEAVDLIYQRKNKGKAEFLLIWADRSGMLHMEEKIFEFIQKKFTNSSFEEVFFLTFYDRKDMFQKSIKIRRVKKK